MKKDYKAALIDMDGVLFDTMPHHARAWQQMMAELGILRSYDEFFLYEGMTGAATIRKIYKEVFPDRPELSDEYVTRLYARKSELFNRHGSKDPMPGADRMFAAFKRQGVKRVLVTGSGQASILDQIEAVYPGAFEPGMRITSHDVKHGKPDPEPYLKGLELAGVSADEAIVVENAPLGVRAGKAAGIYTVALMTGPIPREAFEAEGADLILPSMAEFADMLG